MTGIETEGLVGRTALLIGMPGLRGAKPSKLGRLTPGTIGLDAAPGCGCLCAGPCEGLISDSIFPPFTDHSIKRKHNNYNPFHALKLFFLLRQLLIEIR